MKAYSLLFISAFICLATVLTAQEKSNFAFGKISPADFNLSSSPVIDSNTNAVIIADQGITDFTGNKLGWFSYIFKRRTRIKILNKKAFELATVKIPLYIKDEEKEALSDVSAVTYNLENGEVTETKLTKKDLFAVNADKNHIEQRFALPAVKEGCIIEYSYTITSDFTFNLPSWEFQNIDYPCLWSDYQVTIPSGLVYALIKRCTHPFFVDKADKGHKSYLITKMDSKVIGYAVEPMMITVVSKTIKHRWVMKDVPAFYVENYLSSPINYIDKIEFQLDQTKTGKTSEDEMPTWKKATEELLKQKDFGVFLNDSINTWLDTELKNIVKENSTDLQTARDIYYYIAHNFTCTNYYNKFIKTSLQDVYKNHNGGVGEINLLLAAMLHKKSINVSPVLLSTRGFGYNYPDYPIMDHLNYVICRAVIDGKIYYLDASHSNLGFGHLHSDCYNGHARIISNIDSASVYFMADSVKESKLISVTIINDEKNKGTLIGNFQNQLGSFGSYSLREAITKSGEKKYFDELKTEATGEIEITKTWIDSLANPEQNIKVNSEFVVKAEDNTNIIYFNPFIWSGYKTNPFAAAIRKYPVEMLCPVHETYILSIEIPTGFDVDEMPKMAKVIYGGGDGSFEYLLQKDKTSIQLRCTLKLKKANFDPEEYNSLREFFGFIVKKQSEQIVFKRK